MSEDNKLRMMELKTLFLKKSFSDVKEAKILKLIALEQNMTENRAALISLLEAEIMSYVEVERKIEVCFGVFLKNVVKLLGTEKCLAIYDFLPGDTLTFYRPEQKYAPQPLFATQPLNVTNDDIEKALRRMRESRPLGARKVGLQVAARNENRNPGRILWGTDMVSKDKQQQYDEPDREGLIENLKMLMEKIEKVATPSRVSIRAQQRAKRHLAATKKTYYGIK